MKFKSLSIFWLALVLAAGVLFGTVGNSKASCYPVVSSIAQTWYSEFPAGGLLKSKYEVVDTYNSCIPANQQWMTRYAISNYGTTAVSKELYIIHKVDENVPSTWKYLVFSGGNLDGGKFNSTPMPAWSGYLGANTTKYFYLSPYLGWLPWETSVHPDQVCFVFDNTINGSLSLDYVTVTDIN